MKIRYTITLDTDEYKDFYDDPELSDEAAQEHFEESLDVCGAVEIVNTEVVA